MPYSGRIPGTFGGGASNDDAAPAIPFATPSNQMVDYGDKPAIPGRIPGTYGDGANNTDPAPAVRFKVGNFDNGQPEETKFENEGVPGGIKGGW